MSLRQCSHYCDRCDAWTLHSSPQVGVGWFVVFVFLPIAAGFHPMVGICLAVIVGVFDWIMSVVHCQRCGEFPGYRSTRAHRDAMAAGKQTQRANRAAAKHLAADARRQAREDYYLSRGIEPGPFAWFKALPEALQPILIGLAVVAPVLIGVVAFAMRRR